MAKWKKESDRRINGLKNRAAESLDQLRYTIFLHDQIASDIRGELGAYYEKEINKRLALHSIIEINRNKDGIRPELLKRAGYDTIASVRGECAAKLELIKGIGEVTAMKILRSVAGFENEAARKIVFDFGPYLNGTNHSELLKKLNIYKNAENTINTTKLIYAKVSNIDYVTQLEELKRSSKLPHRLFWSKDRRETYFGSIDKMEEEIEINLTILAKKQYREFSEIKSNNIDAREDFYKRPAYYQTLVKSFWPAGGLTFVPIRKPSPQIDESASAKQETSWGSVYERFKQSAAFRRDNNRVQPRKRPEKEGVVTTTRFPLDIETVEALKKRYIAFDTETTGLYPDSDRIIELGAVLVENGNIIKSFGSLVKSVHHVPIGAASVNHITDQMISVAPMEEDIYPSFIQFMGDALQGKTLVCAHNAGFDMGFLENTLKRLGHDAEIRYVDTLRFARRLINTDSYTQDNLASGFGITNRNSHRAEQDARVCAQLLWKLLPIYDEYVAEEDDETKTQPLTEDELNVCRWVQGLVLEYGRDTHYLCFHKNSSGLVTARCRKPFFRFKISVKGNYVVLPSDVPTPENVRVEPCSNSEGGADNKRLYFREVADLFFLKETVHELFLRAYEETKRYIHSEGHDIHLRNRMKSYTMLTDKGEVIGSGSKKHPLLEYMDDHEQRSGDGDDELRSEKTKQHKSGTWGRREWKHPVTSEPPKDHAVKLSQEQELFMQKALGGNNILVDACIGSGKTTAIQHLCDKYPPDRKILYLTYNKLLKADARAKIRNRNVTVTNYHSFANACLKRAGISSGVSELILAFNKEKPPIGQYDVLIIDEYQDIETEFAEMLVRIKESNPGIQIIAVGDMQQKVYDWTTLDAAEFLESFLGEHLSLSFTQCFRLSAEHAAMLGRVWNKKLVGVNDNCRIKHMTPPEIREYLAFKAPKDILCLGRRNGEMAETLNYLETFFPETYNKHTVFASIKENDSLAGMEPDASSAIFTTYDSSKGLERAITVLFDFTERNWKDRKSRGFQSYEILRNIFCVAASRGKGEIIFVDDPLVETLSERTLSTPFTSNLSIDDPLAISEMFEFKYTEDVERCFSLLDTKVIPRDDETVISIYNRDGLIDLSPCIGTYQEASYFDGYSIDKRIQFHVLAHPEDKRLLEEVRAETGLEMKILLLTSSETKQRRYKTQVRLPFIREEEKKAIHDRLATMFTRNEEVQTACALTFATDPAGTSALRVGGMTDVIKDGIVYELKFVSELEHGHFLQCACYMVALGLEKGILWNVKDNKMYEIRIPDKKMFLDAVARAITKGRIKAYYMPNSNANADII